jgi:hypothetical protein
MSQKDNVFTIRLVKKDGKLQHQLQGDLAMYNEFVKGLEEGQVVEAFFEAYKDDGTNPQLAKIHASIRKLAMETGNSVDGIKEHLKMSAGLCWVGKDKKYHSKSFGDCSKEELGLVIEVLNAMREYVNLVF